MKKRIFIPLSISFSLLNILFWGFAILPIYLFIHDMVNGKVDTLTIVMPFIFIILFYNALRFLLSIRISLKQSEIKTYGDGLPKFEKIQYKCSIKYKEIKDVAIVASEKNSLNKKISFKWVSSSMPKKYLEFTLTNDTKKRMCINYYNKKQIIKILTYLNLNMQVSENPNTLNVDEIMKDWYIFDGYNREDLKVKRGEKIHKKDKKDKV